MNHKNLAIFAVIISMVIWGATATVMKYTLESVPPFSLGFLRFFGASLLFLPFLFKKINLKDISPMIILTGLVGITLTLSVFFTGIKYTTALNAGAIIALTPLLTLIAAHSLLSEKVKKNVLIGCLLGIAGIGVIIGKDILEHGLSLSPFGDFLILLSILGTVYYSIASKKILQKISPMLTTFYILAIGGLGFIPGAIWEWQVNPNWALGLSNNTIFGIIYGILLSSFTAHSLYQWALSKMEATKAGFYHYIEPIVTTITAVLILSENITTAFIIGSLFIFSGLVIAETHRHKHVPHHR